MYTIYMYLSVNSNDSEDTDECHATTDVLMSSDQTDEIRNQSNKSLRLCKLCLSSKNTQLNQHV